MNPWSRITWWTVSNLDQWILFCFLSVLLYLCSILQESCPLAVSISTAADVFQRRAETRQEFRFFFLSLFVFSWCSNSFYRLVNQPDFRFVVWMWFLLHEGSLSDCGSSYHDTVDIKRVWLTWDVRYRLTIQVRMNGWSVSIDPTVLRQGEVRNFKDYVTVILIVGWNFK